MTKNEQLLLALYAAVMTICVILIILKLCSVFNGESSTNKINHWTPSWNNFGDSNFIPPPNKYVTDLKCDNGGSLMACTQKCDSVSGCNAIVWGGGLDGNNSECLDGCDYYDKTCCLKKVDPMPGNTNEIIVRDPSGTWIAALKS